MNYMIGCNYWASNAGTEMWRNWDEEAIKKDMEVLQKYGIKYLRVFPNWRDFQPACAVLGGGGHVLEYHDYDDNVLDNAYYIDMKMMERFSRFCDICEQYGMKLVVGLITGWMSGRLFVPPALKGKNLYTDELALLFEQKFIKGFVTYFANREVIYAWDLGNECNCMCPATQEISGMWTAMIPNAIRAHDKLQRPIFSGMHSIGIDSPWTIQDQAENTDVLTTHPYPQFVPHCFIDDMLSYRTLLHATSESTYYATVGGKPCIAEEVGTLGPSTCDYDVAAAFIKTNFYSTWANNINGLMWWCANEQVNLSTAPYKWNMMERELGFMDENRKPRKILEEFKNFSDFLKKFNDDLPELEYDGVCVLSRDQDQWGMAYVSYMLGKQAGVNIAFTSYKDKLPDSDVYLLPSISGTRIIDKPIFDSIIEKVKEGAVLYISNESGTIAKLEELADVHICNSLMDDSVSHMDFDGEKIDISRKRKYIIESSHAIAYEDDSMPVFTKCPCGKGYIYYLNFPVEFMMLDRHYFDKGEHYRIYKEVFKNKLKKHVAIRENKYIGLTIHESGDKCYAVLINYSDKTQKTGFKLANGYEIAKVIKGNPDEIEPNDAAVVMLKK